jgi:hypothetical protein
MADIVREIIANPFVSYPIQEAWLSQEVVHLCYTMRRSGNYDSMEQLGEMLEGLGCDDTDMLLHCSSGGHHRGCWLVDLLIGRDLAWAKIE